MNIEKQREELLRESAAYGDEDNVKALLNLGVNINAQHIINGWTALHWASKRGQLHIVNYLLSQGADASIKSNYGETPFSLAKTEDIRSSLPGDSSESFDGSNSSPLPITPNYLSSPVIAETVDMQDLIDSESFKSLDVSMKKLENFSGGELVLKVRTSDPPNQDFIEIEIPTKHLSYENVFKVCCEELEVLPKNVMKLRKLPNTVVRKDKDVLRFQNFQELELVLEPSTFSKLSVGISQQHVNGTKNNNALATNSASLNNSNFCKNEKILY